MLSLFNMELNGFPLMHACVNVRFPPPLAPDTHDHAHAWMGTHTYAHMAGTGGGVMQWQTGAEAGMAGTMEGCGVLF